MSDKAGDQNTIFCEYLVDSFTSIGIPEGVEDR